MKFEIQRLKCVDSTNEFLKRAAANGTAGWTVVLADEQTSGKGRMGRNFHSPNNTGLYMSVLVRPNVLAQNSVRITACTAVAVRDAIQTVAGVETQIKWANDLFLHGRKICGILVESAVLGECIDYTVIGIGINLKEPQEGFPEELKGIASSLLGNAEDLVLAEVKEHLAMVILNNLAAFIDKLNDPCVIKQYMLSYKAASFLIGREVMADGQAVTVIDIDEEARLVVRTKNGKIRCLVSGEVSIVI